MWRELQIGIFGNRPRGKSNIKSLDDLREDLRRVNINSKRVVEEWKESFELGKYEYRCTELSINESFVVQKYELVKIQNSK